MDFSSTGDPHHEILATTREQGWLDLFVQEDIGAIEESRSWVAHPNGHFQPGLLALTKEGHVLYRWRVRPSRNNLGGAIVRPTPEYVWKEIEARLDGSADTLTQDAPLDATPELDMKPIPWPIFLVFLLAHGWFMRPKVFPDGRAEEKIILPDQMYPRIALFALLIIGIFVFLPTIWAVALVAAWAAFVWPKIARISGGFQNIPVGDPGES